MYYPQANFIQQQPQQVLRGRPVSSVEEMRASPIDFDGTIFYFPDQSNNCIYTKQIDLNGRPVYKIFKLAEFPQQEASATTPKYVSQEQFDETIKKLLQKIEGGQNKDEQHYDF